MIKSLKHIYSSLTAESFLNQYPLDFKYAFYFFVLIMNGGGLVWGILALVFHFYHIAYIPFGYIVFSLFNLYYLYKYHNFKVVRFLQVLNSILLPFVFQWLLGGFVPSGAVMLWSFLALIGLLTFYNIKNVWFWFVFFVSLMIFTLFTDAYSFKYTPEVLLDTSIQRILFTINITMIGGMMFFLARYFIASNREKKRLNTTLQDQKEELISQNQEINEKNEEIMTFSEQMKQHNEEILAINEDLENQKRLIEQKSDALLASINYAKRIQEAVFGDAEEIKAHFPNSFLFYKPKDVVSGDFYWFSSLIENSDFISTANPKFTRIQKGSLNFSDLDFQQQTYKIIVVADCTGHGVPGAFMTVLGLNLIEDLVYNQNIINPAQLLSEMDKKLIQTLQKQHKSEKINDGMDLAIVVIDENNKRILYSGAKNPVYFLHKHDLKTLKPSIFPVGSTQFKQGKTFKNIEVSYDIGDSLYLFSDGFQDQFGGKNDTKYMKKRFREFISQVSVLPFKAQYKRVEDEFNNWKGEKKQTDDVILLGLKL